MHDPGIDREGTTEEDPADRVAQSVDVANEEVVAAPLEQVDGEEIISALYATATIVGNGASAPAGFHHALSSGGSRFALDPPYRVLPRRVGLPRRREEMSVLRLPKSTQTVKSGISNGDTTGQRD